MEGHLRSTFGVLVLLTLCTCLDRSALGQDQAATDAASVRAVPSEQDYRDWVNAYAEKSLDDVTLLVTVIEGEPGEQKGAEGRNYFHRYGSKVATDGTVSYFMVHAFSRKGSSGPTLPADKLEQLDEMLKKLPDDKSRLPPSGRRIMIQSTVTQPALVRVYDRANIPSQVVETLRFAQSTISHWVPEFKPQATIEARDFQHGGFLCTSPDQSEILFTSMNGPVQRWNLATHERLGEIQFRQLMPLDEIVFNPDASKAALTGLGQCEVINTTTWQRVFSFAEPTIGQYQPPLSAPRFTPDGKYLIVQGAKPMSHIYESATWTRVPQLPDLPTDTRQYFPAPKQTLAILQLEDGAIVLRDMARKESVATLDQGGTLYNATFSPDETQFVTVTGGRMNQLRLRLWDSKTGTFVREFRHYEREYCVKATKPFWSPCGKYLLAATAHWSWTSEGVTVWNLKTGRHRGEFVDAPTSLIGVELVNDQLIVGCADGKIRFWDFPNCINQIRELEDSLSE